jgi:hypothetical protein
MKEDGGKNGEGKRKKQRTGSREERAVISK